MINKVTEADYLKFKQVTPKEKEKRGILGRLYGPIADCILPTRNGRKYTEDLWTNVFSSDIIKEKFENGGIFGELCHPDYDEVDMAKVAIVMPEPPKKDKNGKLVAYVDILDTPCGKIAYQLAKYGYKFGISSRGQGDLMDDFNGEELVDPDTYTLNAFDLVELPAVKEARLSFVESYQKPLRESLDAIIKREDEEDQRIMEEKLRELHLDEGFESDFNWLVDAAEKTLKAEDLDQEDEDKTPLREEAVEESLEEIVEDTFKNVEDAHERAIEENQLQLADFLADVMNILKTYDFESGDIADYKIAKKEVVDDKPNDDIYTELSEALEKANKLEAENLDLQEQIAVCTTKVEECNEIQDELEEAKKVVTMNNERISNLVEKLKKKNSELALSEKLLNKATSQIKEVRNQQTNAFNERLNSLNNELKAYKEHLANSKKVIENYRKNYSLLREQFIATKAEYYGIDKNDISRKLTESKQTKKNIDEICEELRQQKLNFEQLPFRLTESSSIAYSAGDANRALDPYVNKDDIVSDSLLKMANFK